MDYEYFGLKLIYKAKVDGAKCRLYSTNAGSNARNFGLGATIGLKKNSTTAPIRVSVPVYSFSEM